MGFLVSFSGMLTFPKAQNVREVAQKMPMERLLIETDAPFLAPMPHRGKRNEPAYLALVRDQVAAALEMAPAALEEATDAASRSLFRI